MAIVNSATRNIVVCVSFETTCFCEYMTKSGIAGFYGNSIFNFLRNVHTVLHGDYQFTSHQQHLLFINCLMMAILTGASTWQF